MFARLRHLCSPSNNATRVHVPNGILIGSAVFAQLMAESPYTLQWAAPFLPENCPFAWGDLDPSNTCFLGPTGVHNPNGISTGAAVFARHTIRNKPTNRPRYTQSVTIGRTYVRGAAMQPNNDNNSTRSRKASLRRRKTGRIATRTP